MKTLKNLLQKLMIFLMVREDKDYYIIGSNKWSKSENTKEGSYLKSLTLRDCNNCIDCETCYYCKDLENCNNCWNCRNSNTLNNCKNVQNSNNCHTSSELNSCHHIKYCSNLKNCSIMRYSFNCTDCSELTFAKSLKNCKKQPLTLILKETGSRNDIPIIYFRDEITITTGCFNGNLEEFKTKVYETYKKPIVENKDSPIKLSEERREELWNDYTAVIDKIEYLIPLITKSPEIKEN